MESFSCPNLLHFAPEPFGGSERLGACAAGLHRQAKIEKRRGDIVTGELDFFFGRIAAESRRTPPKILRKRST
jgi:hypothetical protein